MLKKNFFRAFVLFFSTLLFASNVVYGANVVDTSLYRLLPRVDRLIFCDNLMTLWALGHQKNIKKDNGQLCRDALFFVMAADPRAVIFRSEQPKIFEGVDNVYTVFVPKKAIDDAANMVFGQKIQKHIPPEGTIINENGYFLNMNNLYASDNFPLNFEEDDTLPGLVFIENIMPLKDGTLEVVGKVKRYKITNDGEFIWKAATFRAKLKHEDHAWIMTDFNFEEEGMG